MDRLALALILLALTFLALFIAGAMRAAGRADEIEEGEAGPCRRAMIEVGTDPYEGGAPDLGIFAAGNASHHHRIIGDD